MNSVIVEKPVCVVFMNFSSVSLCGRWKQCDGRHESFRYSLLRFYFDFFYFLIRYLIWHDSFANLFFRFDLESDSELIVWAYSLKFCNWKYTRSKSLHELQPTLEEKVVEIRWFELERAFRSELFKFCLIGELETADCSVAERMAALFWSCVHWIDWNISSSTW